MESESSTTGPVHPRDALAALDRAAAAHDATVARATTPRWYYPAAGCSMLWAFASVSIGWDVIPYGVIIGLLLGPVVIQMAANHATGVSFDRFSATPGARRISLYLGAALGALIPVGLLLEWGADLRGTMAVLGVVAFAAVVLAGRRLERVIALELRGRA